MEKFKLTLDRIISKNKTHAKFLNSLSLMERIGARKITRSETLTLSTQLILKHAAEEARHAYYLKKQISKLGENLCPTYEPQYLLAPHESRNYLHHLDIAVCRHIKNTSPSFEIARLKYIAYLLVTYLIEVRADSLYGIYQEKLEEAKSRINVKSIIAEEKNHLAEMKSSLFESYPGWEVSCAKLFDVERDVFKSWSHKLSKEI